MGIKSIKSIKSLKGLKNISILSSVICQLSTVICHLSSVNCPLSTIFRIFSLMYKLVEEARHHSSYVLYWPDRTHCGGHCTALLPNYPALYPRWTF